MTKFSDSEVVVIVNRLKFEIGSSHDLTEIESLQTRLAPFVAEAAERRLVTR